MHDTGFQLVTWLFLGVFVVGFVVTFVLAIAHIAMFGTVFSLAIRRIRDLQSHSSRRRTRRSCGHCKSLVSSTVTDCPNCGAPIL